MSSLRKKWRWPNFRRPCSLALGWLVDRLHRWEVALAPESVSERASRRVEDYLLRAVSNREAPPRSADEARRRADMAVRFVEEPYWALMCQMLTGTTRAEFEEMLSSDERLAINRASVAICRKVMRMPFIDIEQGKAIAEQSNRFSRRAG